MSALYCWSGTIVIKWWRWIGTDMQNIHDQPVEDMAMLRSSRRWSRMISCTRDPASTGSYWSIWRIQILILDADDPLKHSSNLAQVGSQGGGNHDGHQDIDGRTWSPAYDYQWGKAQKSRREGGKQVGIYHGDFKLPLNHDRSIPASLASSNATYSISALSEMTMTQWVLASPLLLLQSLTQEICSIPELFKFLRSRSTSPLLSFTTSHSL